MTDSASPPQVVTQDFTVRVSAREQQGGSQNTSAISFGGPGGRQLAQVVTAGANGTLTGFGFNSSFSCSAAGVISVAVQRLTPGRIAGRQHHRNRQQCDLVLQRHRR